MLNIRELNSRPNRSDFNCYSFAIGDYSFWHEPDSYNGYVPCDMDEMLENCVCDILADTDLVTVDCLEDIPMDQDAIGFRFAIHDLPADECFYDWDEHEVDKNTTMTVATDFHFILRHQGQWFHKPGMDPIEELRDDPEGVWNRFYDEYCYNGPIVWLTRA